MHTHTRTTRLLFSVLCLLSSVLYSPAPAVTAPVNVPPSATLDLTNPRQPTLFVVGYSHLDTQWRWDYRQTIGDFLPATYNDNLSRIAKFPHYIFNFTGASRYKLIKDYYPEAFEKIRAAVAAGRWFPNGSAWEENDANIPSAESQIRQLLQGREFFLKEFGTQSNEFMLPDCFGFPASLPSILCHCGIRGFSTQKLTSQWGAAQPIPFNIGEWIGTDGNSVIAAINPGKYSTKQPEDTGVNSPDMLKRIQKEGDATGIYADYVYLGIGDRGGAAKEEAVKLAEQIETTPGSPMRVLLSRADLMFNSISDEQMKRLPKYTGDFLLTEHSAGVLTSQAYMKHWNRANELLADAAERASVAAWLLGAAPYPREKLTAAWQLVLRSQFHDILPGTSIPKAYEFSWNDEVLCMNTFAEILTNAAGAVASGMDTRVARDIDGVPLVVYNPLSIEREDVVEATVNLSDNWLDTMPRIQVFGPDGNAVPTQLISEHRDSYHVVFLAKVPSVGFAVYSAKLVVDADIEAAGASLKITDRTLENARYRVTLNAAGDISSIHDKQQNRELLASPARLAFQPESPSKNPAWNMDWADRKNPPRTYVGANANAKPRIEIVENGPVRVALRVTRDAEGSTIAQTIRLSAGGAADRIEISNTIDWQSKGCSLKAEFPLTVSNPLATYNDDLGKIQRANNDPKKYEVPTHQWFDLTAPDNTTGVTILTAAKYGTDKPSDNTLRLTLLYSPDTSKTKRNQEQSWQDWGRHEFTYGIYAHAGDWRQGGSDWQALRMEQPLLAFTTTAHDGKLGRTFSLLQLNSDALAVRAVKLAENSDQIIVRIQELNGTPQTNVRLTFPAAAAIEVNGVETLITPISPIHSSALALDFQKYQLRSFALTSGEPRAKLAPAASVPVTLPCNTNVFGYRGATNNASFDATGSTIPAEMIPDTITSEGIAFKIGPHAKGNDAPNALRCEGQTIVLPVGNFNRVYLLAASATGDTAGKFTIGGGANNAVATLKIQNWTGYIGSWDNRVYAGETPEQGWIETPLERIDAGYIKRDPVAWYCDHRYDKTGKDMIYSYCYLFKYALSIPPGVAAKTITLPNNPAIRILAMTAAADPAAGTQPARPLYDDFTNRAPIVIPAGWATAGMATKNAAATSAPKREQRSKTKTGTP